MSKTYRECAIEHLKQGNLCKGYVDYIVGEVEKLQKIEQIINTAKAYRPTLDSQDIQAICKVLENKWKRK